MKYLIIITALLACGSYNLNTEILGKYNSIDEDVIIFLELKKDGSFLWRSGVPGSCCSTCTGIFTIEENLIILPCVIGSEIEKIAFGYIGGDTVRLKVGKNNDLITQTGRILLKEDK